MKILIILATLIILMQIAFALEECKPLMQPSDAVYNCSITSTWNYTAPCSGHTLVVYNGTGQNKGVINYSDYGATGLCTAIWNISSIGSYTYIVDNGDSGSITIEGDKKMMSFTVIFFLLVFNIAVFIIPLVVRSFTHRISTDYVIKHLFWMGGILFLWFNMTILRQMALDAGLGIDKQLAGYWWFFTVLAVCVELAMIYVTAAGAVKLSQEIKINERMGNEESVHYEE